MESGLLTKGGDENVGFDLQDLYNNTLVAAVRAPNNCNGASWREGGRCVHGDRGGKLWAVTGEVREMTIGDGTIGEAARAVSTARKTAQY